MICKDKISVNIYSKIQLYYQKKKQKRKEKKKKGNLNH